ncbi:MAG: hypothetical protein H7196_00990 [candidate division SR1 bacterium]|nr:hypothetical protein [candidate division SR1 bacterium]
MSDSISVETGEMTIEEINQEMYKLYTFEDSISDPYCQYQREKEYEALENWYHIDRLEENIMCLLSEPIMEEFYRNPEMEITPELKLLLDDLEKYQKKLKQLR